MADVGAGSDCEGSFDIVVIGGGIVGVATAMVLLQRQPGLRLVVLEKEPRLAAHQTGHNSGVIHSGLYYRPGSLKARNCVAGREALYRFCSDHQVAHRRCGKLVVATHAAELAPLAELERRGRENGLCGLQRLDAGQLREYEPHAAGIAGLWVPETGVVDYREVTEVMARLVVEAGGVIATNWKVKNVTREGESVILQGNSVKVRGKMLVNCAGLHSDRLALSCGMDPGLQIIPFRGEYYEVIEARRDLVRQLVYPVPDPKFPFLGVHLTRMIDGRLEAGPNAVLALSREGYGKWSFSPRDTWQTLSFAGFWPLARRHWRTGLGEFWRSCSKRAFVNGLQRLVPELVEEDVIPGGSGVRAQAVDRKGNLIDDFRIVEGPGMVHVLNAPSPAATASLSIADAIAERVLGQLS